MTQFNCALIRNHEVVNVIVLDDAVPFDGPFLEYLATFDEAVHVDKLASNIAGMEVGVGWVRPGPGQPLAPKPTVWMDGFPFSDTFVIAADGKTVHTARHHNPQFGAPASVVVTLKVGNNPPITKTVAFDASRVLSYTFTAPAVPTTATLDFGGHTVTIQAV